MIKFLFLDMDDTILDFKKSEKTAIAKTLADAGLAPTPQVCRRYSEINDWHWKRLETGELTRDQVLHGRFAVLFGEMGVTGDPVATAAAYMNNLAQGHDFIDGALDAVQRLSRKYRLFLASNGTAVVQNKRIDDAGLRPYFEKIFISQAVGFNKPAKGFFDGCFRQIPDFDPREAMIVGDSLTSDIRGGQNAGIATCWVNPGRTPCTLDTPPDYEIESLSQLEALLSKL